MWDVWRYWLRRGVADALLSAPGRHPVRALYSVLRRAPGVTLAWRALAGGDSWKDVPRYAVRGGVFADSAAPGAPTEEAFGVESYFTALINSAGSVSPESQENRVVLVNNGLSAGGAERQVVLTLSELKRAGVDVSFIGEYLDRAPGQTFHLETLRTAGVAAHQLARKVRPGKALYANISRASAGLLSCAPTDWMLETLDMIAALRALRPQVVHLWQDDTCTKHAFSALLAGVPKVVLSGRNLNPTHFAYHRPYMRAAYRALAQHPRVVLSNNSAAGACSYAEWLDLDVERIIVLRNGVAVPSAISTVASFRRAHRLPSDRPLVCGVFRLSPEKRPLLWLEAAAHAAESRPDLFFVIAGSGPMEAEVRARAEAIGVSDRLALLGEVRDIRALFESATLFFLTSAQEGLPNVVLEAQSVGLMCLATDAGGMREALADGKTGIIAADPGAIPLAQHIVALVGDETFAKRVKANGPAFVAEHFAPKKMIAETLALYGLQPTGLTV